jgi:NADPH:quinone reductase-like Zn-dependent oxidoreductase
MTTSIPQTMQAWLQTSRGQPKDVLELDEQHAVPTPGDKEVLIKTKVVSLNPVGHKTMKFPGLIRKLPNIVEYDLSGVVVRSESANFRVGDEVFGMCVRLLGCAASTPPR